MIQRRSGNRYEATFSSQTGRVSYPRGKESGEPLARAANAAATAPGLGCRFKVNLPRIADVAAQAS